MTKPIHVAVGVVRRGDEVLVARRPDHVHQGGRLEFPGGKVEPGEPAPEALKRELAEELGIGATTDDIIPLIRVAHDYDDKCVLLDVFEVTGFTGEPHGVEGQPVEWRPAASLDPEAFPAANGPIIHAVQLSDTIHITGEAWSGENVLATLREKLEEQRPQTVLLRAPWLSREHYAERARALVPICRDIGARLVLHGEPSALIDCPDADGIHLPWRVAEVLEDTRPVSRQYWLGVSCHNEEELAQASVLEADYVFLGPVQATASHPTTSPMGWEIASGLIARANRPAYALGGLSTADVNTARHYGARGIATISGWWRSPSPETDEEPS
ncbi:DNA mismatch repair protein MutT [Tamilnaduibacter salinus]|uniref:8-oxo-dGTP diphosphatase n=1 Tax=Tamilnaduibacter salinus TaxID=1484056 RepID=A0A2A2I4I4_9GAMM|nr:Nudix family hydrolase [Tamilnaduibacter salinus]PAV26030.1 DNA mismatch repair protein MutT [Tamilnaduibacter salinus]